MDPNGPLRAASARGYTVCEMDKRDPTVEELREREQAQERAEREAAATAASDEGARASLRRADKARYLREKLEQQERADRES